MCRKPTRAQPEGDADQRYQHRHLDQRADDRGEGDRRSNAKGGDSDRYGGLEVVAGRCESDGCRARIVCLGLPIQKLTKNMIRK